MPNHAEAYCTQCAAQLEINVTMISQIQVFCPNVACGKFAQTFWIGR